MRLLELLRPSNRKASVQRGSAVDSATVVKDSPIPRESETTVASDQVTEPTLLSNIRQAASNLPEFNPQHQLEQRRLRFLHLEKTGGTVLTQQLALLFAEKCVQPWGQRLMDAFEATRESPEIAELPRGKFWRSHRPEDFHFFAREHVPLWAWNVACQQVPVLQNAVQFAVFREPDRWLVSLYHHYRRKAESDFQLEMRVNGMFSNQLEKGRTLMRLTQKYSLLDFIRCLDSEAPFVRSQFIGQFVNMYSLAPHDSSSEARLASAIEAIGKLDFVGLQSSLTSTCQYVAMLLNMPMQPSLPTANTGGYVDPDFEEVQGQLNSRMADDWRVYESAVALNRSKMRQLPAAEDYNENWCLKQSLDAYPNGIQIPFSGAIPGCHWHTREGGVDGVPLVCWSTDDSTIFLPIHVEGSYQMTIRVRGVLNARNMNESHVRIANVLWPLVPSHSEDGFTDLSVRVPRGVGKNRGWSRVVIVPAAIQTHEEVQPGCGDHRRKGLLVERIQLVRYE